MKNYIFGAVAIALAFTASAFTTNIKPVSTEAMNKKAIQSWYFMAGHSLADAKTPSAYSTTPSESCDAEIEVPCQIQFEASQYASPSTNTPLQNYLNAHATVGAVLNDAVSKRSE